ncbi:MAG TPA: alpha/beta hydrolase-fold protein [Gemmatimonadaceae bacterium]|nr:alpha/beta hydrolase-fold protein [Gemmatimonadaceae bacterium]
MSLITRVARVAVLVTLPVSTAVAQDSSRTPWVQEVVNSTTLGKRVVYVASPDGYAHGIERYGVLVLLDAGDLPQFRLGIAQAAYLADNEPGIPPLIVVGIVNGADRLHDMLPAATGSSVTEFKTAGGAAAFADFIVGEVLPMVRAKYRTLPMTILAGHSAGGLFAVDVAATRPSAFPAIIAMSPALWYNDSSLVVTYADAIAKSTARPRLFAASGGLESDIDVTTRRFAQRLDSIMPASHTFAYQRYPNDTHALTPLSSLPDGLRFVFAPVSLRDLPISSVDPTADSATVFSALSASEASYATGARSLLLPDAARASAQPARLPPAREVKESRASDRGVPAERQTLSEVRQRLRQPRRWLPRRGRYDGGHRATSEGSSSRARDGCTGGSGNERQAGEAVAEELSLGTLADSRLIEWILIDLKALLHIAKGCRRPQRRVPTAG